MGTDKDKAGEAKGSTPSVSACICVESAGQDVTRAIESVKDIVSEIILIESSNDTKSKQKTTDGTPLIEVAKEYGAGYFVKDFENDISKLMSAAIRVAGSDFVIILDPDEELTKDSKEQIEKLITAKHYDVFHVKVVNYDVNGDPVSFYYRPKMFRADAGFRYEGEFIPRLQHNSKEKYTSIAINHYGYALSKDQLAIKVFLNDEKFKKQTEREPDNPYCYFYAAEGNELVLDFDHAKANLAKAVKILTASGKATQEQKALLAECYYALARIALSEKNYDEALKNGKAGLEIAKNSINLNFILGEINYALKDFEAAKKHYFAYLELRDMLDQVEDKSPFMVFDAAYYVDFMVGKALLALGNTDEALTFFEKSLDAKPGYASTLNELGCLYKMQGDINKAKEYFSKAYETDPLLAEAACNLGVVSFMDEPEKGLEFIKKAMDLQPDNAGIKSIYENYSTNKDRILEKRRVSLMISPYDYSNIKDTVNSTLTIFDEVITLGEDAGILSDEELGGKRMVLVGPNDKMRISYKRNMLLENATMDWVLFLKEGESISKDDTANLIELTRNKDVSLYYLRVILSSNGNNNGHLVYRYEPRLFRRGEGVAYDDIVFDRVNSTGKSEFSDVAVIQDAADTLNKDTDRFKLEARALNDELTNTPKNGYARFLLGKMFFAAKDYEKAAAEFELSKHMITETSADNVGYPLECEYLLGCTYMVLKKPVKAREVFKAVVDECDDFFDAYYQLGCLTCFNSDEPKEGIEYFEKYFSALKDKDKSKLPLLSNHTENLSFKAHYYHGILYQKTEEPEKAIESFKSAIALNPDYVHPYINLANLAIGTDDTKSAKDYLKRAVALDNNNFTAHHQLAIIYVREKAFDAAQKELGKCIEINGDSIEALSLLGRIHEETMNLDKAERCYRAIVDKQPQDKNAILKLGDILLKKDDTQAALRVFRDLLAMKPSFVPANVSVGKVLIQTDKLTEAETHFNDLMKKYPNVSEYVLYASKVAILKKNFGDALTHFDTLVRINPKSKNYVDEQKKALKDKGII